MSAFPVARGDTDRTATIVVTTPGNDPEQPMELNAEKYHSLIGALRCVIDLLNRDIRARESKPGSMTAYADLIARQKAQRDEAIEVLVCFDI